MTAELSREISEVSGRMDKFENLLPMIIKHMERQTEILESMAVYQERTSSLSRRVGAVEGEHKELRQEMTNNKLEIRANTVKVLLGSSLMLAVVTMAMKEFMLG